LTTPVPALPDSYLRAIIALPDDDGPRLCAADWWDEQGAAERAEFVRVQCELARMDVALRATLREERESTGANTFVVVSDSDAKAYDTLRRRERELRTDDNVISWLPVVEPWGAFLSATCASHLGPGDAHCCNGPSPIAKAEFRRGFVAELTAAAADFLAHADALTAACPLRRVRLTTWPEVWAALEAEGRPILPGNLSGLKFGLGPVSAGGMYAVSFGGVASVTRCLLADRFPGITFELPTAEFRLGSLSPFQVPLTTDGGPILPNPRILIRGVLL
jgi:uncharacterized protein (TIGR02996 family)